MIFFNNQYAPPDPEPRIGYVFCQSCGSAVPMDEAKIYTFKDGEVRTQCNYCQFHPDEIIVSERAVEEPDYWENIENYYE